LSDTSELSIEFANITLRVHYISTVLAYYICWRLCIDKLMARVGFIDWL